MAEFLAAICRWFCEKGVVEWEIDLRFLDRDLAKGLPPVRLVFNYVRDQDTGNLLVVGEVGLKVDAAVQTAPFGFGESHAIHKDVCNLAVRLATPKCRENPHSVSQRTRSTLEINLSFIRIRTASALVTAAF